MHGQVLHHTIVNDELDDLIHKVNLPAVKVGFIQKAALQRR